MSPHDARRIVDALAGGIDPETGEVLPADHLFRHRTACIDPTLPGNRRPCQPAPTKKARLAQSPWLTDFLAGTLVVKMPPPQVHRAPAGLRFSASDAEFGVLPRRRG